MNHPAQRSSTACVHLPLSFILHALFGLLIATPLRAQSNSTGALLGKVYNPATQLYVYRAEVRVQGTNLADYTESDGSYRIEGIPPGEHTVTVTYTGSAAANETMVFAAGTLATHDFNIFPPGYNPAAGDTIKLSSFTVSAEREGSAKAIMEQRAALNAKNVVASDNYGEGTDGNVGEFIKFIPGVVIDYGSPAARGAMIGGLSSAYTNVMVDGTTLGSGASGNFGARAVELDALSLANIASVEINKTLTADMDASAPGGTINLRSKNAFDRKDRLMEYNFGVTANSYNLHLGATPGPREETTNKIKPTWKLDYSDIFFNHRLGVQLTASYLTRNTPREFQGTTYNYGTPARGPFITTLQFSTNSVLASTLATGLNLDFKATPDLTLSWRSNYSARLAPSTNRTWSLTTSAADVLPESTLEQVVTKPDGVNTRLQEAAALNNNKYTTTLAMSPRFKYRKGDFVLAGGVDYSLATAEYKDMKDGFFSIATSRLSSMSWMAQRSGPDATDWRLTELSGRPWSNPASYDVDSAVANNVGTRERRGVSTSTSGNLDATFNLETTVPLLIKAGVKARDGGYKIVSGGPRNWTYLGTGASQTAPGAQLPTETIFRYGYNGPMESSNVGAQDFPYPDRTGLYQQYVNHPEYFVPDAVTNFKNVFLFPNSIKEQIDAAYLAAGAHWQRFRFESGARYELTRTAGKLLDAIPAATIAAARPDLVAGTIPYIIYQYHNGARETRYGRYGNIFYDASAKYQITHDLDAQLSFSDAILRPTYDNLAGVETVDDTNRTVTVANPDLKPQTSRKYYTALAYYFEPAGTISVGAFVLDVKNIVTSNTTLSQADAGYTDFPEYNGYTFISPRNGAGTVRNRGLDVAYNQQLVFLPGPFKGISVFGSLTRLVADGQQVNVVNKAASGGVAFRYRGFDARVNANWQAPKINSISAATINYVAERTVIDVETSYRLSERFTVFLVDRNANNAPAIQYDVNGVYGHKLNTQYARYGASLTLGVKGSF